MATPTTTASPEDLAKLLLVTQNGLQSQAAQIAHRQNIINVWGGISPGTKVLELGCGQGDCTIVLADAVGSSGSVDAVDPTPPGYGSPFTVEEAHRHISTTILGPRINWIHADSLTFLPDNAPEPTYDIGILCHSLWYFSSPPTISETLRRLRLLCKMIFIAEWSLTASSPSSYPHVLAALTQASLECRKPQSESNVRTVVSPAAITKLAEDAGLKLVNEGIVENPGEHVYDGLWEVGAVSGKIFIQEIEKNVKDERERAVVHALRDATVKSLEPLPRGVKDVRSMNVWCGVFEKA
ncbi:S-adenosyl-L-methionine-dependent methyltransferase [Pholiota conissans]|uniref:S-adenosyl-L-methionine-dependent methyltransferase n=1 Tax=Pholiota conissans TaxID=109636 RepID=A0A9P6D1L1_9AGAR|nr:S-adenosyl-L-methionine-dependent methyltransferase [Pholiota conissans]